MKKHILIYCSLIVFAVLLTGGSNNTNDEEDKDIKLFIEQKNQNIADKSRSVSSVNLEGDYELGSNE